MKARKQFRTSLDKVFARLFRGPATNRELSKIALRFGARVYDLREEGYKIMTEPQGEGVVTYRLLDYDPFRRRGGR